MGQALKAEGDVQQRKQRHETVRDALNRVLCDSLGGVK